MAKFTFRAHYSTPTGIVKTKELTLEGSYESAREALPIAKELAPALVGRKNTVITVLAVAEPQPPADPFDGFTAGQIVNVRQGQQKGRAKVQATFFNSKNEPVVVVESLAHGSYGVKRVATLREMLEEPETVEYHAIYPDGAHYTSDRPVKSSQYGVDNLIQIRVTKRGNKIVKKEIV